MFAWLGFSVKYFKLSCITRVRIFQLCRKMIESVHSILVLLWHYLQCHTFCGRIIIHIRGLSIQRTSWYGCRSMQGLETRLSLLCICIGIKNEGVCISYTNNKTNDLILNLTPENVTQHSRIE